MAKKYAIIVAGGSGSRMGSAIPKQFLELGGRPVLMHTIEAFHAVDAAIEITLVLPASHQQQWGNLCRKYSFSTPHSVVAGGSSRFQSVRNGLGTLPGEGIVAIHDGVRPLVSPSAIAESFRIAEERGSAIVSLPLKESIREVDSNTGRTKAKDRTAYRLVQTPQTFVLEWIKKAYRQEEVPLFTDDASVAEAAGFEITLIEGNEENIKITHPADIVVAEALMRDKKSPT